MKKIVNVIVVCVVLGVWLSGCGSKTQTNDVQEQKASSAAVSQEKNSNANGDQEKEQNANGDQEKGQNANGDQEQIPNDKGDQGQAPAAAMGQNEGQFERPDLSGEIVSVNGSEINLKIIETPELGQPGKQGMEGKPNDMPQNDGQQNGEKPQGDVQQNGEKPQGDAQQNGEKPEMTKPEDGGNQLQGGQLNYTGETKTISVTENIAITTFSMGENGGEEKNLELEDLEQGDVLQIFYSDKDNEVISKISVMEVKK